MAERTNKDYAIEHAGYMADAAKWLMERMDAEFDAREALEAAEAADADDAELKADDLRSVEEDVVEARTTLRNRIYEFEKRRDRALATAGAPPTDEGNDDPGTRIDRWAGNAGVPVEVTDAMVDAYLQANDAYWKRTDELPTAPGKWRTGTPREATRESLRAALGVDALPAGHWRCACGRVLKGGTTHMNCPYGVLERVEPIDKSAERVDNGGADEHVAGAGGTP